MVEIKTVVADAQFLRKRIIFMLSQKKLISFVSRMWVPTKLSESLNCCRVWKPEVVDFLIQIATINKRRSEVEFSESYCHKKKRRFCQVSLLLLWFKIWGNRLYITGKSYLISCYLFIARDQSINKKLLHIDD